MNRARSLVATLGVSVSVVGCGPIRAYPGAPRPAGEIAIVEVDPRSKTSSAEAVAAGALSPHVESVDVYVDDIDGSFSLGVSPLLVQRPIHLAPGRHRLQTRYRWSVSLPEERSWGKSCVFDFEAGKGERYVFQVVFGDTEGMAELLLANRATGEVIGRCGDRVLAAD